MLSRRAKKKTRFKVQILSSVASLPKSDRIYLDKGENRTANTVYSSGKENKFKHPLGSSKLTLYCMCLSPHQKDDR